MSAYKLNEVEREVIACSMLDARMPVSDVARLIGRREHAVRYAFKRLREEGVLKPYALINVYALGLTNYAVYFSRSVEAPVDRQDFLRRLYELQEVTWLGEVSGDYNTGIVVSAHHIRELDQFLSTLACSHGKSVLRREVVLHVHNSSFRLKYLANVPAPVEVLAYGGDPVHVELDDLDIKILRGLGDPNLWEHLDLARFLGIPLSTLRYRLGRLEDTKVIAGYGWGVTAPKFGMHHYKLLISERQPAPSFAADFFNFCLAHPHIIYHIRCIGPWSLEVGVQLDEPGRVPHICAEISERFGSAIGEIRILTELSCHKYIPFPPDERLRARRMTANG